MPTAPTADTTADVQTRFLLPHAGVRGVHVALHATWLQVASRNRHPPAIRELLGEALAASALFTGHAKVDGRLSVQLRGEGALRTLFAECTAAGTLRGIARLAEGVAPAPGRDLRTLAPGAVLAITIENPSLSGNEPLRYQGLVPIDSDTLSGAFEGYFHQSEQLPTRVLLAADDACAAGLMLQKLPGEVGDGDGWNRAGALFETLQGGELLSTPVEALLHRLFHQDVPQRLDARGLRFGCSCSPARVAAMLQSLGEEESRAAIIDGEVNVQCEFCAERYRFTPDEIDALFQPVAAMAPAPDRLQ